MTMNRIGFIGMGKVGSALAQYFAQKHLPLSGFYTQSTPSLPSFESLQLKNHPTLTSLIQSSDMLFITTPDSAIEKISEEIAEVTPSLKHKIILHCSGALASHILMPCRKKDATVYSLHPLQAFTGASEDVLQLAHTFFTVETEKEADRLLLSPFLQLLGNAYQWIQASEKPLYHAAAVLLSNYMVTLVEEGLQYLRHIGFKDQIAISMMMPLMTGTLTNIQQQGTTHALAGPILRNDHLIVAQHLTHIKTTLGEDAVTFYKYLGRKTLTLATKQMVPTYPLTRLLKE